MPTPQKDIADLLYPGDDEYKDVIDIGTTVYPRQQIDGVKHHFGFLLPGKNMGIVTEVGPNMVKVRWLAWGDTELDMRPEEIISCSEYERNQRKDATADKPCDTTDTQSDQQRIDELQRDYANALKIIAERDLEIASLRQQSVTEEDVIIESFDASKDMAIAAADYKRRTVSLQSHYTEAQVIQLAMGFIVKWVKRGIATERNEFAGSRMEQIRNEGDRQIAAAGEQGYARVLKNPALVPSLGEFKH